MRLVTYVLKREEFASIEEWLSYVGTWGKAFVLHWKTKAWQLNKVKYQTLEQNACTCGSVLRLNVRNVKLRNYTVNLPEAIACN